MCWLPRRAHYIEQTPFARLTHLIHISQMSRLEKLFCLMKHYIDMVDFHTWLLDKYFYALCSCVQASTIDALSRSWWWSYHRSSIILLLNDPKYLIAIIICSTMIKTLWHSWQGGGEWCRSPTAVGWRALKTWNHLSIFWLSYREK